MITDKDIVKLKKIFPTKKDLKKYATKDDLKNELKNYPTKKDLKNEFDKHTKMIVGELKVVIDMIGQALERTKEHDDILDDHERQLDRLNDKVFSST